LRLLAESLLASDRVALEVTASCWEGELDPVWMTSERCRILGRRLARREQLVRARSRAKNEISAVLQRRLIERPGFADCSG
jgi:transposase